MSGRFPIIRGISDYRYKKYLPTAFDDSLTLVEKVNKIIYGLNSVIDDFNDMAGKVDKELDEQQQKIVDLRDEFESLKEDIGGEYIPQEVEKVINILVDDGSLAELINDTLLDSKADKSAVDNLTSQTLKISNINELYINPKNFLSLDDTINYARLHGKYIKADTITLTKHTNFRGVGLEVNTINLNGFMMELGDYNTNTVEIGKVKRPSQSIENVVGIKNSKTEFFIRGACYQTINIGHYNGFIQLRMNDFEGTDEYVGDYPSRFIAYNVFNFFDVSGVEIRNDSGSGETSNVLWCNENVFNLTNTMYFSLGTKGDYHHNLNRIYGGTFEGNTSFIKVYSGRYNKFYDIRGEGNFSIHFEEGTRYNDVYMNHYTYVPSVLDDGYMNKVMGVTETNIRLIQSDYIYANQISSGSGTPPERLFQPFRNLEYDVSTRTYMRSENAESGSIFYETPFIENPKNIRFLLESNLYSGLGFGVGYKYYDENYNDITVEMADLGFTSFIITTTEGSVNNNSEGSYRGPSRGRELYHNSVTNGIIKNDIINLVPSGHWVSKLDENTKRIKYVKIFVGHAGQHSDGSGVLKFYDLRLSIFDISSNYRLKYFQNYIMQ